MNKEEKSSLLNAIDTNCTNGIATQPIQDDLGQEVPFC